MALLVDILYYNLIKNNKITKINKLIKIFKKEFKKINIRIITSPKELFLYNNNKHNKMNHLIKRVDRIINQMIIFNN